MKRILKSWKHPCIARVSIFLIALALILGTVSCAGPSDSKYALTMAVDPSGSGTATDLTYGPPYAARTVVDIQAVAAPDYRFASWSAPTGTFGDFTAATTSFTMPAQDVTVTANFVRVYYLTMAVNPVQGGLVFDLTNASPYEAGTAVSIQAIISGGYQFDRWTAPAGTFANANAPSTTFTMPAQDVVVTANCVGW